MKNPNFIDVVIITHNSSKYIIEAIKSIFNSKDIMINKIIVIDNGSKDNTPIKIKKVYGNNPKVEIIRLSKNLGFPLSANIGVVKSKSNFIVIMNPDVIVDKYCFKNLLTHMLMDSNIAVSQPKILHPGGYIDSGGSYMDILGHGYHIGKYEKDIGRYNKTKSILYATFSCAMVRRDIYVKLLGMDPKYFLYNEDLDYGLRAWLADYKIIYIPTAIAYHIGHHSIINTPFYAIYFGRRNRLYTIFKNYPFPMALLLSAILVSLYIILIISSSNRYEARLTSRIMFRFSKDIRYLIKQRRLVYKKKSLRHLIKSGLITFKLYGLRLYLSRIYKKQLKISQ